MWGANKSNQQEEKKSSCLEEDLKSTHTQRKQRKTEMPVEADTNLSWHTKRQGNGQR